MQQLIQSKGSLQQLPDLIKSRHSKRVLFVTGRHLANDPYFTGMCSRLTVPYTVMHPPDGVLQLNAILPMAPADAIVAIGGGKTIDFAKGVLYQQSTPAYFLAAPTTAGSGSEATPIAVFYNNKEKVSLDAPHLLPAVAILDATLVNNLPPKQRAISGADALAQAIESVWNVHSTNESEAMALPAAEMVWQHLPLFVTSSNEETVDTMQWAAYLAGRAISLTRTTGPHALSYYLTAHFGVPHGQAVALTLPLFFLYNDEVKFRGSLGKVYKVLGVQNAADALKTCRSWLQQVGLATTLTELNLQDLNLDEWLRSVNRQRFGNNPVPFDAGKLKRLFHQHLY